jgi:hypothetical protein
MSYGVATLSLRLDYARVESRDGALAANVFGLNASFEF